MEKERSHASAAAAAAAAKKKLNCAEKRAAAAAALPKIWQKSSRREREGDCQNHRGGFVRSAREVCIQSLGGGRVAASFTHAKWTR